LSSSKPSESRLGIGKQNLGVVEFGDGTAVQDEDLGGQCERDESATEKLHTLS
jgi:hypothetical protein